MLASSNPALNRDIFQKSRDISAESMTVEGTVNKSLILLALLLATAWWSWQQVASGLQLAPIGGASSFPIMLIGSAIGAFVVALVTIFLPKVSPYTAPCYALLEGVLLGSLSATMEMRYPGIVTQAVIGTFGTFFTRSS